MSDHTRRESDRESSRTRLPTWRFLINARNPRDLPEIASTRDSQGPFNTRNSARFGEGNDGAGREGVSSIVIMCR